MQEMVKLLFNNRYRCHIVNQEVVISEIETILGAQNVCIVFVFPKEDEYTVLCEYSAFRTTN